MMPSETPTESMEARRRPMIDIHAQAALDRLTKAGPIKPKKQVASRDNAGKAEWDYIFQFPTAVEALCRVMELGAVKYERDNWKRGGKPDREYISAVGRHISAFKQGVTVAPDTGCLHLAHAMWNLMALIELNGSGVTHDSELFAKMKEHWEAVKEKKQRKTRVMEGSEWIPPPSLKPTSHSTDEGGLNA